MNYREKIEFVLKFSTGEVHLLKSHFSGEQRNKLAAAPSGRWYEKVRVQQLRPGSSTSPCLYTCSMASATFGTYQSETAPDVHVSPSSTASQS